MELKVEFLPHEVDTFFRLFYLIQRGRNATFKHSLSIYHGIQKVTTAAITPLQWQVEQNNYINIKIIIS